MGVLEAVTPKLYEVDLMLVPFVPDTPTVNADRSYFVSACGTIFVKMDTNLFRGRQEAEVLKRFTPELGFLPRYIASTVENGQHVLWMENVPGKTLENTAVLTGCAKDLLLRTLPVVVDSMFEAGLVHRELHESNVLFEPETGCLHVIDLEMATDMGEHPTREDYGEEGGRYGLPYLYNYVQDKIAVIWKEMSCV